MLFQIYRKYDWTRHFYRNTFWNWDFVEHIKQEFEQVDREDPKALRKFFLRYSFLTTNDLVLALGLGNRNIRGLKTLAGFRRKKNDNYKNVYNIQIPKHIKAPDNWDTAEWWRANYPRYGMWALARMTGLSYIRVRSRLKRHGIPIITHKEATRSRNLHCDKEWLEEHYVRQGMSIRACARLVGVSDRVLCGWLNYFKIEIRSHGSPLLDQVGGV